MTNQDSCIPCFNQNNVNDIFYKIIFQNYINMLCLIFGMLFVNFFQLKDKDVKIIFLKNNMIEDDKDTDDEDDEDEDDDEDDDDEDDDYSTEEKNSSDDSDSDSDSDSYNEDEKDLIKILDIAKKIYHNELYLSKFLHYDEDDNLENKVNVEITQDKVDDKPEVDDEVEDKPDKPDEPVDKPDEPEDKVDDEDKDATFTLIDSLRRFS